MSPLATLSRAVLPSEHLLDEIERPLGGGGLLVDLGDVASKASPLGDHQRIGLDVAADTAGRRNLHIASGDHVAVVVTENDGVHRLHVGVDDAFLANDQLAAYAQLAAYLALDLDRVGDVEFAFHLGGVADDGEQGDGRGGAFVGRRGLLSFGLASEHRSLLHGASAAALCREYPSARAAIPQPTDRYASRLAEMRLATL